MDEEEENESTEPAQKEEDKISIISGWEEASHDVKELPGINIDRDFVIAKSYLQRIGCRNETIWDHLNDILNHVMKERPPDCMRYFEDLSRELRVKKFFLNKDCDEQYKEITEEPKDLDDSKILLRFYRRVECLYESETPFDDKFGTLDLFPIFKLLNEAGIGFPYSDIYNIQMGMRLLPKIFPIEKLKLWGKVSGTLRDYIIVEAELSQQAMTERLQKFTENVEKAAKMRRSSHPPEFINVPPISSFVEEEHEYLEEELDDEVIEIPKSKLATYVKPPLPVPIIPEIVVIPSELPGEGVNRKVYYVANDPSEEWFELPDITPEQIVKARKLHRFLTGILTNEVPGFPKFPGTEKEYLRAQIARISATTHASPLGFYSASGEEEEAAVVEEGQLYTENVDYQPLPVRDLLDPTFEFWVHHEPYILNQGRTVFWSPPTTGGEDEFEAEEGEGLEKEIGEKGPPILSSLSGDVMADSTPPWAARRASTLLNEESVVVLRSNLWPGALTAVKERLFVNFYAGWGTKCFLQGFNPDNLEKVSSEYELGPEIMEMMDPTVEMEEFRWMQLHPKIVPQDMHEEGGEEEVRQEEEEEP